MTRPKNPAAVALGSRTSPAKAAAARANAKLPRKRRPGPRCPRCDRPLADGLCRRCDAREIAKRAATPSRELRHAVALDRYLVDHPEDREQLEPVRREAVERLREK